MTSTIIFMRHGEDEFSHGHHGLSSTGKLQAQSTVGHILNAGIHIDLIWHSPKERALDTAIIAAKLAGIELTKLHRDKNLATQEPLCLRHKLPLGGLFEAADGRTLLAISHAEDILYAVSALTKNPNRIMRTDYGTAYVIERTGKNWWPLVNQPHRLIQEFRPA